MTKIEGNSPNNKLICGAKSRCNNNQPCRSRRMKNGRCRMHGGCSTGAKTPEGKRRIAEAVSKAHFKHGRYSNAAILERKKMIMMMQWKKELLQREIVP